MAHVQPLSDEQASPQAKPLFDKLQSAIKMVPNIFRTMGHAPSVLEAALSLDRAIHSDLDAKLRELAYIKTSRINHCPYCLHYHERLGRKAGLTEEQLKEMDHFEHSSAFNDLEKQVLRFAEQWTRKSKADPAVVAALSQSLTPTQLVVLAGTVALANWTNRFNETFEVQLP